MILCSIIIDLFHGTAYKLSLPRLTFDLVSMQKRWTRLVRFIASDGRVYSGDAIVKQGDDARTATHARVIRGNPFGSYSLGSVKRILQLLQPIPFKHIKTVRCLGINYIQHAAEANIAVPKYPIVFNKPGTAVTGPNDQIPVPRTAQVDGLDYEVELVVVIGKECRYVSRDNALKYVAGYAVGNDVSQRTWQMSRGGGQWTYSKGFDGFAPLGPAIVNAEVVDPSNLDISSKVNGELRQNSNTSDMVFDVGAAIEFLSNGATLMPGDLIFMGTPQGVGLGFKPPKWLHDGDVVECSIKGLGSIRNKVNFLTAKSEHMALDIDSPVQPPTRFTLHRKSKI